MFGELPTAVTKFKSFELLVQFPTAPGVAKNTPVQFCGYQIGRVTDVMRPEVRVDKSTGKSYYQILVVMRIDNKYNTIPSNVDIKLIKRGLGSSYIELVVDPSKEPTVLDPNRPETVFLVNGLMLQGTSSSSSEFLPEDMQKKIDSLVENLSTLAVNTNHIIGDPNNREHFKVTMANLARATDQLNDTLKEVENFSSAGAKSLKNADERFNEISESFIDTNEKLSDSLREFKNILAKINEGQGSAGKLINDNRLYENLVDSSERLEDTLSEIQLLITEARDKGIPIKLK